MSRGIEVIENCQLEWDKDRCVLYVHNRDTGATILRICRMFNDGNKSAHAIVGKLSEGQIDITGPFDYITFPKD